MYKYLFFWADHSTHVLNAKKVCADGKTNIKTKWDDVPEIMLPFSCLCYHVVHIHIHAHNHLIWLFFFCYCFWFHDYTSINSMLYFKDKRSISIIFSLAKIQIYSSHHFTRCYSLRPSILVHLVVVVVVIVFVTRVLSHSLFLIDIVRFLSSIVSLYYHTKHTHTTRLDRVWSSCVNDLREAFSCLMSMIGIEMRKKSIFF
jgi:hypothetical protein